MSLYFTQLDSVGPCRKVRYLTICIGFCWRLFAAPVQHCHEISEFLALARAMLFNFFIFPRQIHSFLAAMTFHAIISSSNLCGMASSRSVATDPVFSTALSCACSHYTL